MKLGMQIRPSTVALWVLSIVSILLALKTSNDYVLEVFRNTPLEYFFQRFPTGNSIIFDFSIGWLVSIIFYLLVVWFPDRRRKSLIKENLKEQYRSFKEDTISIFLNACGNSNEGDLPRKLSEQSEFKKYFKEIVTIPQSNSRWDCVLNGLNEQLLKDLLVELEVLMNEVAFVLNNVKIDDRNVFSFFKRLSQTVYKLKNTTLEYEDIKNLSKFLWELFTGFSFIDEYPEHDIVERMIREI
ncbi:MAG: hypothetical protein ACYDBV_10820 [Nitrospiria bacterium]